MRSADGGRELEAAGFELGCGSGAGCGLYYCTIAASEGAREREEKTAWRPAGKWQINRITVNKSMGAEHEEGRMIRTDSGMADKGSGI